MTSDKDLALSSLAAADARSAALLALASSSAVLADARAAAVLHLLSRLRGCVERCLRRSFAPIGDILGLPLL
jgi:hypothetical protein